MKPIKILYSAAVAAVIALSSCSNVDEDDRYIYVKPAESKRCILVEDFTGQSCINCPEATEELSVIQQQYGADTVIVVGIHSGPFGHANSTQSSPRYPLCTETGDAYFVKWLGKWETPQPAVIVNRKSGILNLGSYGAAINSALESQTPVKMELANSYDAEGKTLTVSVSAETSETVEGKLQVWIVEDNIVSTQYMPNGSPNRNYVHNHVFRASVTNDIYGDAFNISAGDGEKATASYTFRLDDSWKAEDVSVVAFVYNDKDGVIQAIKKHIIE